MSLLSLLRLVWTERGRAGPSGTVTNMKQAGRCPAASKSSAKDDRLRSSIAKRREYNLLFQNGNTILNWTGVVATNSIRGIKSTGR